MLLSKVFHCHQSFSQDFSCGHAVSMFHLLVVFFFHSRPLEAHEALPVRQHRVVTESQLKDSEENAEVGYKGRNSK